MLLELNFNGILENWKLLIKMRWLLFYVYDLLNIPKLINIQRWIFSILRSLLISEENMERRIYRCFLK